MPRQKPQTAAAIASRGDIHARESRRALKQAVPLKNFSCQLLDNMLRPADSVPASYPDAHTLSMTHAFSTRRKYNFSAGVDGDEVRLVLTPYPASQLLAQTLSQNTFAQTYTSSGSNVIDSGDAQSYFGKATSWSNPTRGDFNKDLRLPLGTAGNPIVAIGDIADPDGPLTLRSNNGDLIPVIIGGDGLPWYDLGEDVGARTVQGQWSFASAQNNGVGNDTLYLVGSTDAATSVTVYTAGIATNNHATVTIAPTAFPYRFFRPTLQFQPMASIRRVMTNISSALTWSGINPDRIQTLPDDECMTLATAVDSQNRPVATGIRTVGQTILVSCMASSFNNGGEIAGVRYNPRVSGEIRGDLPSYNDIGSTLHSRDYPLTKGIFGFRTPDDTDDVDLKSLQTQYFDDPCGVLAVAARFDSAGASVRVIVETMYEVATEWQVLAPIRSRVAPEEILLVAKMMEAMGSNFVENPLHEKFIALLKKVGSGIAAAAPYVMRGASVAAKMAPLLLAL